MIEIGIRYDPETGHMEIGGPVANKVLFLGILEAVKSRVLQYDPSKHTGLLIPRHNRLPPLDGTNEK